MAKTDPKGKPKTDEDTGLSDGWDSPESEAELNREPPPRAAKLRRYRLPQPKGKTPTYGMATFVTQNPVFFREHEVLIPGNSHRQYVTCISGTGEKCPCCEDGNEAKPAWAFMVIDHSVWKDRRGSTHRDEVRAFIAKQRTAKELKAQHAKRKGLGGCTFEIRRTDGYSPAVGDKFDFEAKTTVKDIRGKGITIPAYGPEDDQTEERETGPLDIKDPAELMQELKDYLKPLSREDLQKKLAGEDEHEAREPSGDDGGSGGEEDDDIPF